MLRKQVINRVGRGLLAIVLLAGLLAQLGLGTTAKADAGGGVYRSRTEVDPADHSLWILSDEYYDSNSLLRITHYAANGDSLGQLTVPKVVTQLGFALEPGARRFYYMEAGGPNESAIPTYINLDDWNDRGVVTNKVATLNAALIQPARFTYNPVAKHFYAVCCSTGSSANINPDQGVVIDVKTNTITGHIPAQPVGFNPTNGKLYATRFYQALADNGAGGTHTSTFFDLVTLDAKTETINPIILLKKSGPDTNLISLQVNSKTGLVYTITLFCNSRCTPPQRAIFDQYDQVVLPLTYTNTEVDYALNETTNQLYSQDYGNGVNADYAALDASQTFKGQLARFGWQPVAIDQMHNLIYAVVTEQVNLETGTVPGLALLVIDGVHLDVLCTLNIREPDPDLKSKTAPLAQLPINFQGRFFLETHHTLSGEFLAYWNAHGGLAVFGLPISEPFQEGGRMVQYFERSRFEMHPENQPPYNVLLGRLGVTFGSQSGPIPSGKFGSGQNHPIQNGVLFEETGHTLTDKFYQYWQANGGLAVFGLPLTEPFQEVNPIDGKTYTVQYFERNRYELHPEFAGSPYEVELGLLGVQYLRAQGWLL